MAYPANISEYLCYLVHLYIPYFPYVPVTTWAFAKLIQSLFGIIPKFGPHPKKRENFFAFNAKLKRRIKIPDSEESFIIIEEGATTYLAQYRILYIKTFSVCRWESNPRDLPVRKRVTCYEHRHTG